MGIPYLTLNLRPFASNADLAGESIVIDGPGLAYHVWNLCLASQPRYRNPIEAAPAYKSLGEAVVKWLDDLESMNVYLKKIYFDGFLPESKRSTRSSRLAQNTKKLCDYHKEWPQIIPSKGPSETPPYSALDLFYKKKVPSNLTSLPPAPFLVPAIIESLLASERYRNFVQVVPDEADIFCADHIRNNGGTVLTSDSDLLVHDLGPEGAVAFFDDLEFLESISGRSLKCLQYKVVAIAKRLNLPQPYGLRSLAFEMVMDPHGSFGKLLQGATNLGAITCYGNRYQEFSRPYCHLNPNMRVPSPVSQCEVDGELRLRRYLWTLDPRISEFVLQLPTFARISGLTEIRHSTDNFKKTIDMFLPFLLDCPVRASAWETSVLVRQLAYGLVNLVIPEDEKVTTVIEHRRQQHNAGGKEWQVPTDRDIPDACVSVMRMFEQIRSGMPNLSKNEYWRTVGVYQDFIQSSHRNKLALSYSVISAPSGGNASPFRLTWDGVQLSSQLQGSYYSFRILRQILGLVLLCNDSDRLPPVLHELHRELKFLPPLNELPKVIESIRQFGSREDLAIIEMIRGFLDSEANEIIRIELMKEDKKNRKLKRASKAAENPPKIPKNIFELLGTE